MKRYAVVGTGGRSTMFLDAITGRFRESAKLVAMCDISHTRMQWHQKRMGVDVTLYEAAQFDQMIAEQRPDVVIVVTTDATHHTYVIRALELGCDVICEKPMTTDATKAAAILDAIARTGRQVRVTFNARYMPHVGQIRQTLASGVIGTPLHVDLQWMLDVKHGADYFRRWHRSKANSGGLLVHKATHHFDLVNWLVGSYPKTVVAMGGLKFYGRANAQGRGEGHLTTYDRYTGTSQAVGDPFALPLDQSHGDDPVYSEKTLRGLYLDAEKEGGYIRDKNVFGEGIDIEDTIGVLATYRSGVTLTYSLIAYAPAEGFRLVISGTKGRLEFVEMYDGHPNLRVMPMFKEPYDVPVSRGQGTHGGGDAAMLADLFGRNGRPDPLGRAASHVDGVASLLLGAAANRSLETGLPVQVDELLQI